MQFSVLTLKTFDALQSLTNGKEGIFVLWEKVRKEIKKYGFSQRQAEGELDRFCYGFECMDRYNNGIHEIAITHVGIGFLEHLLDESPYQTNQIAFLIRKAKRKKYWNATIQESTFFNPEVYRLISEFKFRPGGARDFIRSICIEELVQFLSLASDKLTPSPEKLKESLQDIITKVETLGKYWASVGSRYSWFVFTQKFELPFSAKDWELYDSLMSVMIRPPEWGGGKDVLYKELVELLEGKKRLLRFRKEGIIRPIWTSQDLEKSKFRLTSPGYLMWERKKKGFLFEFRMRRLSENNFELALCDATDLPQGFLFDSSVFTRSNSIPSLVNTGTKEAVIDVISNIEETSSGLGKLQQKILY